MAINAEGRLVTWPRILVDQRELFDVLNFYVANRNDASIQEGDRLLSMSIARGIKQNYQFCIEALQAYHADSETQQAVQAMCPIPEVYDRHEIYHDREFLIALANAYAQRVPYANPWNILQKEMGFTSTKAFATFYTNVQKLTPMNSIRAVVRQYMLHAGAETEFAQAA